MVAGVFVNEDECMNNFVNVNFVNWLQLFDYYYYFRLLTDPVRSVRFCV
jgi:hypothetical protein